MKSASARFLERGSGRYSCATRAGVSPAGRNGERGCVACFDVLDVGLAFGLYGACREWAKAGFSGRGDSARDCGQDLSGSDTKEKRSATMP